jgi:hypothetical protein
MGRIWRKLAMIMVRCGAFGRLVVGGIRDRGQFGSLSGHFRP